MAFWQASVLVGFAKDFRICIYVTKISGSPGGSKTSKVVGRISGSSRNGILA
jgi:hypothetical protein